MAIVLEPNHRANVDAVLNKTEHFVAYDPLIVPHAITRHQPKFMTAALEWVIFTNNEIQRDMVHWTKVTEYRHKNAYRSIQPRVVGVMAADYTYYKANQYAYGNFMGAIVAFDPGNDSRGYHTVLTVDSN